MRLSRTGLWRFPDFLSLWAAQSISRVGTHISLLALPLIAAVTLDASPFAVGALAATGQAPMLLAGLFAGAWVDRRRRRPIMIAADLGRAAVFLVIPFAAAFDLLTLGFLFVVAFAAGTLTVFFDVSYLSYLPGLVRRDQLIEANTKLEASASIAQVAGPGLGGLLIALLTAPFALIADALSFIGSAVFLARIRTPEPEPPPADDRPGGVAEIREGPRYVRRHAVPRALAGCSAVTNLFGYAFLAVYVLYMAEDLDLGAGAIGLVFATGGAGALAGALLAGRIGARLGVGRALIWTQLGFGVTGLCVPAAVLVPRFALPLVVAAEFLQWLCFVAYFVNAICLRQALTEPHIRGRVNATFTTVARGMQPLGSLLGGWLGSQISLPWTLVAGEAGMFLAVAWLLAAAPLRQMKTASAEEVPATAAPVQSPAI